MLTQKQLQARRKNAQKCKKYNNYKVVENIAYVELSNKKNIMICDIEDWEKQKEKCWLENTSNGYAETTTNGKKEKYHYHLLKNKQGYVRDHINKNKLDNRTCNLRYASKHANSINTKLSKANNSGFKGVCKYKNKWQAYICVNKKTINLGHFDDIESSVKARMKAEEIYHKPIIQKETL